MSYLHIGQNAMIPEKRIIGIFDLDITSQSKRTREFLEKAEREGVVVPVTEDIPKSFLVCDHPYHRQIVYISQLNTQTLQKRSRGELERRANMETHVIPRPVRTLVVGIRNTLV